MQEQDYPQEKHTEKQENQDKSTEQKSYDQDLSNRAIENDIAQKEPLVESIMKDSSDNKDKELTNGNNIQDHQKDFENRAEQNFEARGEEQSENSHPENPETKGLGESLLEQSKVESGLHSSESDSNDHLTIKNADEDVIAHYYSDGSIKSTSSKADSDLIWLTGMP